MLSLSTILPSPRFGGCRQRLQAAASKPLHRRVKHKINTDTRDRAVGHIDREDTMDRKPHSGLTRRTFTAGVAASTSLLATPAIVRAQGAALKVGVLLPRSGFQASIGQDCQRGADLAPAILRGLGLPGIQLINADTETNVEVARARAEKL